jgi:hypothetical protein
MIRSGILSRPARFVRIFIEKYWQKSNLIFGDIDFNTRRS